MTTNPSKPAGQPIWLFMAATAMATTISTLAATAMVKSEQPPAALTCTCEAAPAPATPQAPAPPESVEPEPVAEAEPAPEPEPVPAHRDAPEQTRTPTPEVEAQVDGPLDKSIIRRVVRAHIDEVRYCYNEGLAHDPELAGRLVVAFTIGTEGKVIDTELEGDTLGDAEVSTCIAQAVERWRFPRPAGGDNVQVRYPFVLEPG